MVPHTLPALAALPPVASGAPGPSATAGDDAAGAPDTFARVLDAAAAETQANPSPSPTGGRSEGDTAPAPTAPDTGDDSATLLAQLNALHTPPGLRAGLGPPAARPGQPSPGTLEAATQTPLSRPARSAGASHDRAATLSTSEASPVHDEDEVPTTTATTQAPAPHGRVDPDAGAPSAGIGTLARSAAADVEADRASAEPRLEARARVIGPSARVRPNDTGSGDAMSQSVLGDRTIVAELAPGSALPQFTVEGEPTTRPADIGTTGFGLPVPVPVPSSSASAAPAAAPAAEARLAASPGSAEFGSQLGAQLSTFVREGIQHARLHLHPAELGPVTVRIQLDGQAAQVHLAADNAFTRQALEQSMPQLAGSLREAGLTLSGGGVFEQPRQRGDDAPGHGAHPPRPARRDETAVETVLRPAVATVARRGVVDLVA